MNNSVDFQAPEVIRMRGPNPHSTLSDVYSFGICLYELLSYRLPYDNIKSRDQILFMVGSGRLKPNMDHIRSDAPRALRTLLEQCIQYEREMRPEFSQVALTRISAGVIPIGFQIYSTLDGIRLPKLKKSASEPNLSRLNGGTLALHNATASPKTPNPPSRGGPFFGLSAEDVK